jgi:hypothetical protein
VLAIAVGILLFKSLDWPIILDVPFLHYIGWQITEGAVPYRDFFDLNLPGTYMLHAAVIQLLGTSDFAFRFFDIGSLLIISLCSFIFCKKYGTLSAFLAATLFPAFHLFNGNLYCGQRDYLILVFIISSLCFFVRYKDNSCKQTALICSGFLLGAGISIKPFTVLWAIPMAVAIIKTPLVTMKTRILHTVLMCCAIALPNILLFSWLFIIGGLKDFFDIYLSYGPLYAKAPIGFNFMSFFAPFLGIPFFWLMVITCSLAILHACKKRKLTLHQFFALFGIAFGIFSFFSQTKGLFYHLYPAFFFLLLTPALFAETLNRNKSIYQLALVFIMLYLTAGLAYASVKNIFVTPWQFITRPSYLVSLKKDLTPRISTGDTIQFLEPDAAGTAIMIKWKLEQPTRMLSDGYLYYRVDHPYTENLRHEFLQDLRRLPPRYIVLSKLGWPVSGYTRLASFPELASWLFENYSLDIERTMYRIYKRIESN